MARTRQKAKQRKAKRLEQERKTAERSQDPGLDRQTANANAEALAEVEEAQLEAAEELAEAQDSEVGAGAEVARHAAGVEAAAAAEAATTGEAAPTEDGGVSKPTRRERRERREAREAEQASKPTAPSKPRERSRGREAARKEPRRRGRVWNFFVQMWAELRRVQWPNRSQVTQATAVVVVFCLIAGAYLGIWDFLFNRLVRWFL